MMQQNYSAPFIQATESIFSTMLGMKIEVLSSCGKKSSVMQGCITGLIGLAGQKAEGLMVVSFEKSTILAVVATFYGEARSELDQDAVDAVGELTNMICGGAKALLSKQGIEINMATPTVVQGESVSVCYNRKTEMYCTELQTMVGNFYLEVGLVVE